MRLYLVRHAIAARRGSDWPDDTRRPLTRKGIARMEEAVEGLRACRMRPTVVAASPLVRAEHTARILAARLEGNPRLLVLEALAPGQEPEVVAEAVAGLSDETSIALVGHEPDLGRLCAWLLGASQPPAFKKGGVCCLDVAKRMSRGAATLVWMATPGMLRRIGR